MNWRAKYAAKLTDVDDAVADVDSGQSVAVAMLDGMPPSLCTALSSRAEQLEDVRIFHFVSAFPWYSFAEGKAFRQSTPFSTNVDREAVRTGSADYYPFALWRTGHLPYGVGPFDFHLCTVSPPDDDGWCSFGHAVWMNPTFANNARTIIAEVDESFIRTGGANRIHVDRIDRLVDPDPTVRQRVSEAMARALDRTEEEIVTAEVICTLVGMELVRDGDTVQIGTGAMSAALAPYLIQRQELGIHTELLPGGIVDLVEAEVVTGRRKVTHPGKVLATGVAHVGAEELAALDGAAWFELYDFTYTDDLDLLVQEPRLTAVNNAMEVDLTGQVNAEATGPWPFTGPGGQAAFAIAAAHSEEGRSIIVLPSSYIKDGDRRSRIVASLPPAAPVTVPRTAVDYVVTEWGIATLRGKTLRERIGELLAVAHPDCKAELVNEANRIYGWAF